MRPRRRIWLEFGLGIALPAFLTVAATVAVVFLALSRMANEVNAIDSGHVQVATRASITEMRRQLTAAHADYAVWNDATRALYGEVDDLFVAENLAAASADGVMFDTVFVLERDGATVRGLHDGRPVDEAALAWFRGGLDRLLAKVDGAAVRPPPETGILSSPEGIVMVAVGPVEPSDSSVARPPGPARLLLVGRTLDTESVARLGRSFAIDGLTLSGEARPAPGMPGISLVTPDGTRLATLVSEPRFPGNEAYDRARTPMLLVLGLLMLVMAFLVATIWKTLSAMHAGQEAARRDASHDALSGLPNRASFNAAVDGAFSGDPDRIVTVVFLDLDGFKDVNDTYGHETGDRLIRAVAAGFQSLIGHHGLLARLGGDEFAALLTGRESLPTAIDLAASMIEFLGVPFDFDGQVVQVGTSVGIATSEGERITPSELVRRADVAMYQAKGRGKNRIEIYEQDMDAERTERARLAVALRRALGSEDLQVHYQPVIDAGTGAIIAVEALLRWIRPGEGPVPPSVFIPIAEETGLIEEIGAWVLRRACRDGKTFGDLRIAVNVSAAQFRNPRFDRLTAEILAEENFPAQRLELDITESYLIAYPERAQSMIEALRRMGVRVALDDFGTGFSSIGYLRRFAFDKVKIDRSVVIDVVQDPASKKLVEATVALADALGVGVTAEGIEHEDEARILRDAGCHELQGYHFGSPTTATEITRRVASGRIAAVRRLA